MRSVFSAPPASRLTGRIRSQPSALRVVSEWLVRHRSRRILARLDTHMLRDIGLSDHDASSEVSKPFWRD